VPADQRPTITGRVEQVAGYNAKAFMPERAQHNAF